MSDTRAIVDEIVRLHKFFEDWFTGVGERSIDEFSGSLDAAFFIVSPSGNVSSSAEIVAQVSRARMQGPVEIRVENVVPRLIDGRGVHIVTYEEHQKRPGGAGSMISTAGLVKDGSCPGGYRWLFVHETWLTAPGSEPLSN